MHVAASFISAPRCCFLLLLLFLLIRYAETIPSAKDAKTSQEEKPAIIPNEATSQEEATTTALREKRFHIVQDQLKRGKFNASIAHLHDLESGAVQWLRSKMQDVLLSQWNINASLFDELPLAILAHVSPSSPLSLFG